ncbi:unnamed protein product [Ambrosiozyma monospora]|uniref:Unnamed protein product n=1 Tax=Ambrosiozyma monospora TaxID=43982 RepID=A0A9W6Z2Y9_AMBMO|nr:unnamed protein product [Ambrosiozyma monospora]
MDHMEIERWGWKEVGQELRRSQMKGFVGSRIFVVVGSFEVVDLVEERIGRRCKDFVVVVDLVVVGNSCFDCCNGLGTFKLNYLID